MREPRTFYASISCRCCGSRSPGRSCLRRSSYQIDVYIILVESADNAGTVFALITKRPAGEVEEELAAPARPPQPEFAGVVRVAWPHAPPPQTPSNRRCSDAIERGNRCAMMSS